VIRTVVSASSALARTGLAAIVRGDTRLALVGEISPRELARNLAVFDPDVLLEQRDGAGEASPVPSVALVDDPRDAWVTDGFGNDDRGPRALLSRDASPEEIVAAIVAVAAGLVAVQPRALGPIGARGGDSGARGETDRLTSREIDVLGELARGVPNKTIAVRLGISEHTVKFHIASIFAKLAVSSRTEAVTLGVRLGLIML
jgi:DNA-binding NarL/FixJ family response regulator